MIWIYGIIALAALGAGAVVVTKYNHALEAAVEQRALAEKIAKERDGWIDVVAEQESAKLKAETALKAREVDRARLQKERDDARASAATLRRDPTVRAWADVELPALVLARLRNLSGERPAAEGGAGDPAGKPARPGSRPEVRRIP
jgi:hypothetical protein